MRFKVLMDMRRPGFPRFFLDRDRMRPLWVQGNYEKIWHDMF